MRSAGAPFACSRSLIVSPIETTLSAERRENATIRLRAPTATGFVSRRSLTAVSGNTSWQTTTSGTRKRRARIAPTAPTIGGSVMHRIASGRDDIIPRTSAEPR